MNHFFTISILVLCGALLLILIVFTIYMVRFLKVLSIFKKRVQQLQKSQRLNKQTMKTIKRKLVEVETTPFFGKKAKRVLYYKNAVTSVVGFRKQQKLKKSEKQITKSKARKVQRKVCKQYGK